MKAEHLVCTACQHTDTLDRFVARCSKCGEPLNVEMFSSGKIRRSQNSRQTIMQRYKDFLPLRSSKSELSLGEGFTPLIDSPQRAALLGLKNLYYKNESANPTWSFKDRGTAVAIQHAVRLGYRKIGTVSTGNMAVSVAAYGARAGLKTYILVAGSIPAEKLDPIRIYAPNLIKVKGDYGDLYFRSLELGKANKIYFMNSDVPYRVEGSKTISFEISEQLNFNVPDFVVVPTSSGGNYRGVVKGFEEFYNAGLIDRIPRVICAQASGCAPIYQARLKKMDHIERVEKPQTMAHAIENPYPPSGNEVLRLLQRHNGISIAVSEAEIIDAQREMAADGLFGQPASAVPLAAVKKMKAENLVREDHTVVCLLSGSGLKYTDVFHHHSLSSQECTMDELQNFLKK